MSGAYSVRTSRMRTEKAGEVFVATASSPTPTWTVASSLRGVSERSNTVTTSLESRPAAVGVRAPDHSPADRGRRLDPFDRREPGRRAPLVECCLKSVWFNRSDIPSGAAVERRSQFFLTDRVRASLGAFVTEAQQI